MLDPPGPPRAQVLRKLHTQNQENIQQQQQQQPNKKGIAIISRYPNSSDSGAKNGQNLIGTSPKSDSNPPRIVHDSTKPAPLRVQPSEPSSRPLQCNEVSSSDDETTPNHAKKGHKNRVNSDTDDGPYKRTRKQSGPPLASRRSIVNSEDSDAENTLPNLRQNGKKTTSKTDVSPRVLRPRNTPSAAEKETGRKRQRSSFETGISSKMQKKTPNHRAKCLRSRMN